MLSSKSVIRDLKQRRRRRLRERRLKILFPVIVGNLRLPQVIGMESVSLHSKNKIDESGVDIEKEN